MSSYNYETAKVNVHHDLPFYPLQYPVFLLMEEAWSGVELTLVGGEPSHNSKALFTLLVHVLFCGLVLSGLSHVILGEQARLSLGASRQWVMDE